MPSWKKVITSGSNASLNSLNVINGITGSLQGTASNATNASYVNPLNQLVIITGSLIQGQAGNIASGNYSHAEGSSTIASGDYSHAEGFTSLASGLVSHAEGFYTTASGDYSHAEGAITKALGSYSHAEGAGSIASGSYSHAEGLFTVAQSNYQHVQGQYNISSLVQSAFIVGNGTDNNNRRNLIYAAGTQVEITGSLVVSDSITGSLLGTASYANQALTASYALSSTSAASASYVLNAVSSSFATTASFVNTLDQNLTLIGNQTITGSLTVTNNLIVLGSSSLQYMSQSTLNIGTNLITVNTFNPSVRFGGLAVIDSGSSPQSSGSFLYDSFHDEFIFVHRGDGTNVTSSHFLVGPQTYNDLGNETYIAANTLLKSQGNEHVVASNITDTSTLVAINNNTSVTGAFTVLSGSAVELQVTGTGVKLGNALTDIHRATGSLLVTGSATFDGNVFITSSATNTLTVRGSGTTSATNALAIQNSLGSSSLAVRNDGALVIGRGLATISSPADGTLTISAQTANAYRVQITATEYVYVTSPLGIVMPSGQTFLGYGAFKFSAIGGGQNVTTGTFNQQIFNDSFTPTTGTGIYNAIQISNIISQSAAATGISRGLFVSASLRRAQDYRAIETTSGSIIFGGDTRVTITGSLTVFTGSGVEFQVSNTGVQIGNAITDTHNITGSLNITGSVSSAGIVSIGRTTTSQAVIQRAQTPAGAYSTIFAAGTGIVDTFPYTMTDSHGATIDMRGGDPTSDQYVGGIIFSANGNTSPLGEGNAIVFKNRTGVSTYTERMRIKYDGNIGIGTNDPTSLLHVNGTIRTDSSGTPAGGLTGGGSPSSYYGVGGGNFMSEPSIWLKINISGTEYYFPGYA